MLNKVKRILQWFIGGCYILSGLACIGEYTMPAIILIILGGVIILPPITKRIPAFKFKKIALILLSSIVMIAGIEKRLLASAIRCQELFVSCFVSGKKVQ